MVLNLYSREIEQCVVIADTIFIFSYYFFRCSAVAIFVSLIAAFAVFIGYLRSKLPDGAPKPSMCTTIKVSIVKLDFHCRVILPTWTELKNVCACNGIARRNCDMQWLFVIELLLRGQFSANV